VLPMRRRRWRLVPGIERVSVSDVAVLTFDDGPSPDGTPQTLDALEQVGATATFFVVGEQLRAHPELGREIVDRGHEVGLHGFIHARPDLLTEAAALTDLAASVDTFEEIFGARPRWYRPPFGRCTSALAEDCMNRGLEVVYWSTWGFDWEEASPQLIAARVTRDLRAGEVVLLHDTAIYNDRERADSTVAAIPLIAAAARRDGLRLSSLTEALQ
jgi:peptidoglycan/xylan/chitin deacetylase (PgdA/CDA1 family)